jgi:hypothetical protein
MSVRMGVGVVVGESLTCGVDVCARVEGSLALTLLEPRLSLACLPLLRVCLSCVSRAHAMGKCVVLEVCLVAWRSVSTRASTSTRHLSNGTSPSFCATICVCVCVYVYGSTWLCAHIERVDMWMDVEHSWMG